MTDHLCRDYPAVTDEYAVEAYLLAIFLRRVLLYTYVGDTAFPIQTTGETDATLVATGDSTPDEDTPTFGTGDRAGINYGGGAENHVGIPSGVHTVSVADEGRILVLRSTANPLHNSGCFLVTGFDSGNNRLIIDYRSGDNPPAESDDSMNWYLYEADSEAPDVNDAGAGGSTTYRGDGDAGNPRIILESPHAMGWQVRICRENTEDNFYTTSAWTAAPGFNGDSSGDFAVGGDHLHGAMRLDIGGSGSTNYQGMSIGSGNQSSSTYRRISIRGGDDGQAVCFVGRVSSGVGLSSVLLFGLPDDEQSPAPSKNLARLFVLGDGKGTNSGGYLNDSYFRMYHAAAAASCQGVAGGANGGMVSAAYCGWAFVRPETYESPMLYSTAADNPFTGDTELLKVEILAGTCQTWHSAATPPQFLYEPRRMGTAPFLRQGRANFTQWTLDSGGSNDWYHLKGDMYLKWGGPAVIA